MTNPTAISESLEDFVNKLLGQSTEVPTLVEGCRSYVRDSNLPLFQVFQAVGPLVTSSRANHRKTGYQMILEAVSRSTSCFSSQEISLVLTFFCNRLKDETSALEGVVRILRVLFDKTNIPDELVINIFLTLANEMSIPTLPVEERFLLFQFISMMMEKHFDSLKSSSNDFPVLLTQMFEGERDPRCLLVFFDFFTRVISRLPSLSPHEEEVFDAIGCYFPVSYHPRQKDPYVITREDLASRLNNCLSCHPSFALPFFQLILEKLSSDRETAKIDCYSALHQSLPSFDLDKVKPYISVLWTYIRTDVMKMTVHEEVKLPAQNALKSLMSVISKEQSLLDSFLTDVAADLQPFVVKKDLSLRPPASDLYVCCCSVNSSAYLLLWKSIIPHLIGGLAFDQSHDNKGFVLEFFLRLFSPNLYPILSNLREGKLPNQAVVLSFSIPEDNDDNETSHQKLNLLNQILESPLILMDDDVESINRKILKIISSTSDLSVCQSIARVMNVLSKKGNLIIGPDLLSFIRCCSSKSDYERASTLLKSLEIPDSWQSDLLLSLVQKVSETEYDSVSEVLPLIRTVFLQSNATFDDDLIEKSFWEIFEAYLKQDSSSSHSFLQALEAVSTKILVPVCDDVIRKLIEMYYEKPSSETDKIILATASFLKTCPKIHIRDWIDDPLSWISKLLSQEQLNESTMNAVGKLICSAVCRVSEVEYILRFVEQKQDKHSLSASKKQIIVLKNIILGLLLKGHEDLKRSLYMLFEYFDEPGSETEAAFGIIFVHEEVAEDDSRRKVVKSFLHQKLFFLTMPELSRRLDDSKNTLNEKGRDRRDAVKQAIIGQLVFLPKTVLKNDLKKIHTLIVSSLSFQSDPQTTMIALECILHLLEDKSCCQVICNNLFGVISSLLKLSQDDKSLITRSSSLSCLSRMTETIPEKNLLPHRSQVVKKLKESLDDKKRIVRKKAAEACHHWILLGQPGNNALE